MGKSKLVWITFNAFIDTDLYIVKELIPYYDIHWIIIKSGNDRFEYISELNALENSTAITIDMLQCGARLRSKECSGFYSKLLSSIENEKPDVIYTSLSGAPYFIPMLACSKLKHKVVLAIHNVHVPKGGSAYWFFRAYNKIALKSFNYYQAFSLDQYQLLNAKVHKARTMYAPFILKDYGTPKHVRRDNRITFLNFGNIRDYKRIDVLIEAAQIAFERTGILFRVIIAGQCNNWDKYESMIRYPELFELYIRRMDNEEVPELFVESDYFVAPYKDIAQSGSSVVAITYNVPIIASRLPAFEEYIDDDITGKLIAPASLSELANTMEEIIVSGNSGYEEMVEAMTKKRDTIFSTEAIVKKYREYIDEIARFTKQN